MKKVVGIIFGGESFEHDVSKMTAKSILENIDRDLFDVLEIYIDKNGKFDEKLLKKIDVAFLAVHGPNCEDGKLQKFLETKKIPYSGPKVKASEINMDKILMHEYFKKVGLPIVDYIGFEKKIDSGEIVKEAEEKLGFPVFVKPNNAGSSVGISKAIDPTSLKKAIDQAFQYDERIIIEKAVQNPREIEIGILGNRDLIISEPGEILSGGEFYSYETKYFKPFSTETVAKNLTPEQIIQIKEMAEKAYRATFCSGYARIDFLLDKNEKIYINEINTLPGFTKISMFPSMMRLSGISYKDLITKIIRLAF